MKITSHHFREDSQTFHEASKDNISSRFSSSGDVVQALSIFDRKVPSVESKDLSSYGEDYVSTTLLAHYGTERPAETLQGEETTKEAIISNDISTVYGQEAYR